MLHSKSNFTPSTGFAPVLGQKVTYSMCWSVNHESQLLDTAETALFKNIGDAALEPSTKLLQRVEGHVLDALFEPMQGGIRNPGFARELLESQTAALLLEERGQLHCQSGFRHPRILRLPPSHMCNICFTIWLDREKIICQLRQEYPMNGAVSTSKEAYRTALADAPPHIFALNSHLPESQGAHSQAPLPNNSSTGYKPLLSPFDILL